MRNRVKNARLIYQDKVKVSRELNNCLYFESNDESLREKFESFDVIESVAAFMHLKSIKNDEEFWNIKYDQQWNSSTEKALYWLTGGNAEWLSGSNFKYKWGEVYHIFNHKFSDIIYDILDNSKTLGDIRDGFMEHLSLPKLYEFSLNNGLIK